MKPSKKEIAEFQKKEQAQLAGREVNRVQDRKTGEYYDPKAKFDELMNKPEIMASLNRLKIR
jgi:hypothetical protein